MDSKSGSQNIAHGSKFGTLTDSELYKKCQEYGGNARMWMKKFAGLLPEVYRRKLYKRRGFASVHHFAKVLAGMNEETVDRILRLSRRLEDKPMLQSIFESGSQSWTKLEKVSYAATAETDREWAEKVTLPRPALEAYIQEYRRKSVPGNISQNKIQFPEEMDIERLSFPLNPSLKSKLELFKQKLEKEKSQALGWAEVMEEMLRASEENKELKKVVAGKKIVKQEITTNICPECVSGKENEREKNRDVTRYIPAGSLKIIQERSRGICEYPQCHKPGEIYHHTRRFAIKKNHDPNFIRYLCKGHEGILQAGLVKNEEGAPGTWKLRERPEWWDLKNQVDSRVAEFRTEPSMV